MLTDIRDKSADMIPTATGIKYWQGSIALEVRSKPEVEMYKQIEMTKAKTEAASEAS